MQRGTEQTGNHGSRAGKETVLWADQELRCYGAGELNFYKDQEDSELNQESHWKYWQ